LLDSLLQENDAQICVKKNDVMGESNVKQAVHRVM